MIWCLPVVLILSMLGGYMLSARALKPGRSHDPDGRRNRHFQSVEAENIGDEIQRLAETWNDLLARPESSVIRQQQFTSDASHDLRTSMAVILATGQLTRRHQRPEEEYREAIGTMVFECDSTSHVLEDLFIAGTWYVVPAMIELLPVNFTTIVKDISQRAATLHPRKRSR
jgi:two-component system heavy metal sensor histidine kinase CusS